MALNLFEDYTREDVRNIFAPEDRFTRGAGTWGHAGIIRIPKRPGDFIFFVSYGRTQGEHLFDEGISKDGTVRWQSQPKKTLDDKLIGELIGHDEAKNTGYLFLRTSNRDKNGPRPYTFLGRLKYLSHDNQREKPVYFDWGLLNWPIPRGVRDRMELQLEDETFTGTSHREQTTDTTDITVVDALKKLKRTEPPANQRGHGEATPQFKTRSNSNYAERDSKNRKLGIAAEELVVKYEKQRLIELGMADLASRVKHVSVEEGDGAGYDVLSFTDDGQELYIEVKATGGPIATEFFLSSNELAFSKIHPENYELRRLYGFDPNTLSASYYAIYGDLEEECNLTPINYRVSKASG